MKLPSHPHLPSRLDFQRLRQRFEDRRAVALLTVLTVMSLSTILVLTFFSLATSEHQASTTYSQGLAAHHVADQAVNMVIAQIREATNVGGGPLDQRRAWASQPGAIRVWRNDGDLDAIYKLYSSSVMKTGAVDAIQSDYNELKTWNRRPEHFVDLNEPVIRGEKAYYPIVHPGALTEPKYPRPLDGATEGVEGFTLEFNQVEQGLVGAKAASVMTSVPEHIAMPVEWIYQLADGTLGVLSGDGSQSSGFRFNSISGAGSPSRENQIVARFGFWADDETAKLNVNTHAGGLAWDIPKAGGELDMNMARYQPAQKEWQRYSGHPATVHLAAALAPGVLDIVNDRDAMEMLFKVVPRVVGGGSESGTRILDTRSPLESNGLVPDNDPLFPSIDDIVMRPDRTPHKFPDARGRPLPASDLAEYLERSQFFITAHSRAPEVNQFNLPKVAMWPIHNAERSATASSPYQQRLTPFDQLIHYCSTVGPGYDYIFRRDRADSATYDYDSISRNREIYEYLNRLMSNSVPGYAGSVRSKYGEFGQRQILTQIFDYIRSTNLHDDTLYRENFEEAFRRRNTSDHLTFTNPRDGNANTKGFGHKGHGQVTPIRIGDTKGFGRFFTLAGADIMVASVAEPGGRHALYPGVSGYQGRHSQEPEGIAFTNLPPLPQGLNHETREPKSEWPGWLLQLEEFGPVAEFEAAWNPANWNWNLAFLDQNYRDAVLADPTSNKFNRSLITVANSDVMRLEPGEKMVQAAFLFSLFCPSIGWGSINPDMQIEIEKLSGMRFASDGQGDVGFLGWEGYGANPDGNENVFVWATNWVKPHREGGVRAWGGLLPFNFTFQGQDVLSQAANNRVSVWRQLWDDRLTTSDRIRSRLTPLDRGYREIPGALQKALAARSTQGDATTTAQAYRYDLVTVPFKVSNEVDVDFSGGNVEFRIFDGGIYSEASARDTPDPSLVQTIELNFPRFNFQTNLYNFHMSQGRQGSVNEFQDLSSDSSGVLAHAGITADPANPWATRATSARFRGGTWRNSRGVLADAIFTGNTDHLNANGRMAEASRHWSGRYIQFGDIVQSIAVPHGDMRLVAAKAEIRPSDNLFVPHRSYGQDLMAHALTNAVGEAVRGFNPADHPDYLIVNNLPVSGSQRPYNNRSPLPFAVNKTTEVQLYGDFDNGSGTMIDGAYINKPDEGNVHALRTKFTQEVVNHWEERRNFGEFPYFSNPEKHEAGGPSYFSPNRIVSGPGMFGSLPSGLSLTGQSAPWQTLLFRPNVVGNRYQSHPGAGSSQGGVDPPDHVILDLFWMPVVEPYAISEPLSTAGKININYEIVPFLHVDRSTALRGVFRSEVMLCIPNRWHRSYKHNRGRGQGYHWRDRPFGGELQGKSLRAVIKEGDTLSQFKERFQGGRDLFKSASEICEIHLVPQPFNERMGSGSRGDIGSTTPSVEQLRNGSYWSDHALVGDNARERPYTNIHQRITTKSNTFQVHYRAQVLQQGRRDSSEEYAVWRPETDSVRAEYRGSSIVERFVNPNDGELPDFATNPTESLDRFYQFRVVNPRRFAP